MFPRNTLSFIRRNIRKTLNCDEPFLALLIAVNDPRLCKLMVTAGEEHRFSLFSSHALMEPFFWFQMSIITCFYKNWKLALGWKVISAMFLSISSNSYLSFLWYLKYWSADRKARFEFRASTYDTRKWVIRNIGIMQEACLLGTWT